MTSFDADLPQSFVAEACDLLDEIDPALVAYPRAEDIGGRTDILNRVFRHFHSLKGSAGFLGFVPMARLTHEVENYLDLFRRAPQTRMGEDQVNLICHAVDCLRAMLASIAANSECAEPADAAAIIEDIGRNAAMIRQQGFTAANAALGAADRRPASETSRLVKISPPQGATASSLPRADGGAKDAKDKGAAPLRTRLGYASEFASRYISEAHELLDRAEQVLLDAEQNPASRDESVAEALRLLHSFKGNSGFMGLTDLEKLGHRMESSIALARQCEVGVAIVVFDTMLQMLDILRQGVAEFGKTSQAKIQELDLYLQLLDGLDNEVRGKIEMPRADASASADVQTLSIPADKPEPENAHPEAGPANDPAPSLVVGSGVARTDLPRPGKIDLGRPVQPSPPLAAPPPMPMASNRSPGGLTGISPSLEERNSPSDARQSRPAGMSAVAPAPVQAVQRLAEAGSAPAAAPDMRPMPSVKRATMPAFSAVFTQASAEALSGSPGPGRPVAGDPVGNATVGMIRNDIRVDLAKLDAMLDLVGELVIAEAMVTTHPVLAGAENESLERAIHQLRRAATGLQDMAMSVRMVPLATTFRRMIRLVFDLSNKAGKRVDLELIGEETEVDKTVIEHIADPLVHIIRNAIDHGIEPAEARKARGKPPAGKIAIEGRHEGGEVWVLVSDDGGGLDRSALLRKGIERGLVQGDGADWSDQQVWQLIFEPGLSTARQVTDISGRGVGMDVVKRNLEKLNGKIDVRTRPGEGTVMVIRIPLTLAIIDGMLVRSGAQRYIIPLLSIRESLRPTPQQVMKTPDGQELVRIRDDLVPVVRLHEVFRKPANVEDLEAGILVVVEPSDGDMIALFADELLGQQETVIKGLTGWIKKARGVSGCTIFGDGEVGLILDVGEIAGRLRAGARTETRAG